MQKNPKIGLALGGGLARGFAHIGVIKVLLEAGVKFDYISGTGMGSVISAVFACGVKIEMIERLALTIPRRIWVDLSVPRMGLISGDSLEELVYLLTGRRTFAQISMPLAVVATDLIKGETVVLNNGLISRAVRASCAKPGIFNPVKIDGKLLVEGSLLQKEPSVVTRKMGADLVLAVDVDSDVETYKVKNILDVLSKSFDIMTRDIRLPDIKEANVMITPDLHDIAPFQFNRAEEAIKRGEEAARVALPLIKNI